MGLPAKGRRLVSASGCASAIDSVRFDFEKIFVTFFLGKKVRDFDNRFPITTFGNDNPQKIYYRARESRNPKIKLFQSSCVENRNRRSQTRLGERMYGDLEIKNSHEDTKLTQRKILYFSGRSDGAFYFF